MPTILDSIAKNHSNLSPIINRIMRNPQLMLNFFDSNLEYNRKKQYDMYKGEEYMLFNLLEVIVVFWVVVLNTYIF